MSRPILNTISAGAAVWDVDVDLNFSMIINGPFAMYWEALSASLPTASLYDDCLALVGTSGAARLWISDGTSWGLYDPEATYQADSTATDVTGLVADLNTLLGKLRTAGIMATS